MRSVYVHFTNTVSSTVEIEVDDDATTDQIIDAAYESDDMPGGITHGAFGSANVDDGDWTPATIESAEGEEIWTESQSAATSEDDLPGIVTKDADNYDPELASRLTAGQGYNPS